MIFQCLLQLRQEIHKMHQSTKHLLDIEMKVINYHATKQQVLKHYTRVHMEVDLRVLRLF